MKHPSLSAWALLVLTATSTAQSNQAIVDQALRDVINRGADLFNVEADYAGCQRMFEGGLIAIRAFVGEAQQKEIDQALSEAARLPRAADRAYRLRTTIDRLRSPAGEQLRVPPKKVDR